jgi:Gas vesicle synthesis protein GvpL/GvpF
MMNPTNPMIPDQPAEALYLYCFTHAGKANAGQVTGIDDFHPVVTRDFGGITAVLSRVVLEEFVGRTAQERMQDITWITPRACRHQAVVEQIGRQTDVFPARFGTIFSTDDVLANLIRQHHAQIRGFLENIKGHTEWSLKGFLDRDQAVAALATAALSSEAQRMDRLSPGAHYFEEKKIRAAAGKQLNQWLNTVLNALMQELNSASSRHCSRALLSRKATGAETDMVLNGAFLVANEGLMDFRKKTEELNQVHAQAGLTFELSGPWPPYSFCPSLQGREA